MKRKSVGKLEYTGEGDFRGFIECFQMQILRALQKQGLLTERQCEKAVSVLKERSG